MQEKTGPKDVLLHILSIIFLYVAVGTFINLVFQYLNIKMPDPLEYVDYSYDSVRWIISVLIIVFPAYLWSVWFLNRSYNSLPERRELKSRKWLIYITLSLAGLLIVGDLVALVYQFLRGEFTLRFFLKVLTVLLSASAVFIYYLWDVKRTSGDAVAWYINPLKWISIIVVALSLIYGFVLVGSPNSQRAFRFDDQRVQDLSIIQNSIVFNYFQAKRKLPESLSEIPDGITIVSLPKDPETKAEYEYRKIGNLQYELCAIFSKPSRGEVNRAAKPTYLPQGALDENWQHGEGRTCFNRTIDPTRILQKQ